MELQIAFQSIIKKLDDYNAKAGFSIVKENGMKAGEFSVITCDEGRYIKFSGKRGSYKVLHNDESQILTLECSASDDEDAQYKAVSKSLFDLDTVDEREIKSASNELLEELNHLYSLKDKRNVENIKLPRSASKSSVNKGSSSYDEVDLATRFADTYSDFKNDAKQIISEYGELLPETFFINHATPFIIEMIKSRDEVALKKLFKLLNDVYDNGTNAAQDVIAVSILGAMNNDPVLMETADKYMNDYMRNPVHEVNKLLHSQKTQDKLKNPPPYKPKKPKKSMMSSLMGGQQ